MLGGKGQSHATFAWYYSSYFPSRSRKPPTEELANESRSTHITVAADMVFSLSHYLSGVSRLPSSYLTRSYMLYTDCHCRVCASSM